MYSRKWLHSSKNLCFAAAEQPLPDYIYASIFFHYLVKQAFFHTFSVN